jgi:hypothetical protein
MRTVEQCGPMVNATGDLAELRLYAALRDRGALTVRTRTAFGAVGAVRKLDGPVSERRRHVGARSSPCST